MNEMFKWMAVLGRLSNQYSDKCLKELGINSSHHPFILNICSNPGITQDCLKSLVYIHPSNITRALEHLEKNAFIVKETLAEDKRTCRLYPTEKAFAANEVIMKLMKAWTDIITKELTSEQVEEFCHLLKIVGGEAADYFYR